MAEIARRTGVVRATVYVHFPTTRISCMALPAGGMHTLVLYRSSDRADAGLRSVCQRARDDTSRVTVVALARQEAPRNGCCDTRSVLWNEVCRDLANEDLSRASRVVGNQEGVEFDVLAAPDRKVVDAIEREAVARGADEIVLADPRGSGLGGFERRRLRRRSAIPITAEPGQAQL